MSKQHWIRRFSLSLAAGVLFVGAACTPAAEPSPPPQAPKPAEQPVPKPAQKPAEQPAAKPAEQPAPAKQQPKPAAKTPMGLDLAEWDRIVEAARQEGQLVIVGPAGTDVRDGLVQPFQDAFPEIEVDYSGMAGAQVPQRIIPQVEAGQRLTDIAMMGTTTALGTMIPAGVLDPVHPYLVGPEVDPALWEDGKFDFGDEAEVHNLVWGNRVQVGFVYNPELVDASEITSYQDLLDPKWRGQIALRDPRVAGAGLDIMAFAYTNEELGLGRDWIRGVFQQQPFITREDRQILDGVARGQWPIAIGPSGVQAYDLNQTGLPIELFPGENLREGGFVTSSNATLGIVKDPPHPNAVKVYLNWLLSYDGQLAWSSASGLSSLRTDVPRDHLPQELVPQPGTEYQKNYKERYQRLRNEIVEFIEQVMAEEGLGG